MSAVDSLNVLVDVSAEWHDVAREMQALQAFKIIMKVVIEPVWWGFSRLLTKWNSLKCEGDEVAKKF